MNDLIAYLGEGKLNELIIPRGISATPDIKTGGHLTRGIGFLGQEFRVSEKTGLKLSNTTVGTIYGCVIKMVRIQPDFGTVALTDIDVGRPLFWNDTKKFFVTPLASATAKLAGIAITNLAATNAKGDIIPIVVAGDVGVLLAGALTKASPVANDPVLLNVAANLGSADVILDATGWTNVQMALRMGRVIEAWNGAAGTVKKMHLDNAYRIPFDGHM
jgi:hypothetical protein